MTMFMTILVAITVASGPLAELRRPAELVDPGLKNYTLLDLVGDCVERHPQWDLEDDLQRTERRYWSMIARNEEVWGADPSSFEISDEIPSFRCRKANAAARLKQLDQALDVQDAAFARATDGIEHGLWVGSLKLCKSSVAEVRLDTERRTKQPALFIKLTPQASTSFASLTRNSVNSRLAVRLEGSIISRPTIYEPMEQGVLLIAGPEEQTLTRALFAIEASRC
jgi:hypothetical protein